MTRSHSRLRITQHGSMDLREFVILGRLAIGPESVKMTNEVLPPLEYYGKFDGYGFFDPRGVWEKVAGKDNDRRTKVSAQRSDHMTAVPKWIGREST